MFSDSQGEDGDYKTRRPPTGGFSNSLPRHVRLSPLVMVVGGVVLYLLVFEALSWTHNLDFLPLLLLLGASIGPVAVLLLVANCWPGCTPWSYLVAVIIGGGAFSTVAAGVVEHALAVQQHSPLLISLVEESAKLITPIGFMVSRVRLPGAGVLFGVAAGLGFGVVETMGYGLQALTAGGVAAVDHLLLLRGLLSPARHVAWTGVLVAVLWQIPTARSKPRASTKAAGVFAGVVGAHTAWDTSALPLAVHVVVALISVLALWAASTQFLPRPTTRAKQSR